MKVMHLLKPRQKAVWMEQMTARHFFHVVTFTELGQADRASQALS